MATSQRTDEPLAQQGTGPHGHTNPLYAGAYQRGCRCVACVEMNRKRCGMAYAKKKHPRPAMSADELQAREVGRRTRGVRQARAMAVLRRDLLAKIKLDRGCTDCGYRKHSAALDFDHVSGTKLMTLSHMGTYSLERIMEEVAKCEVVCFCCHRIRGWERMQAGELSWVASRAAEPTQTQAYYHRYVERGRAFLAKQKLASGCKDCGYRAHAAALDFDHVRGVKSFSLASRPWWSIKRLTEEAEKCEVVCANCHRIRTFERH